MANRTVIVDNNTWNNTHIATVGRAMASNEEDAFEIMQRLDVDYVLVIFGGLSGYSSDDINKFLWMVRIGGGVYPQHIQEKNYLSDKVRIDAWLISVKFIVCCAHPRSTHCQRRHVDVYAVAEYG